MTHGRRKLETGLLEMRAEKCSDSVVSLKTLTNLYKTPQYGSPSSELLGPRARGFTAWHCFHGSPCIGCMLELWRLCFSLPTTGSDYNPTVMT